MCPYIFLFMLRFTHLIFDLDGTLVDTKADLAAATNYVLAYLGLPHLPVDQVTSYVGNGVQVLMERALGPAHVHLVDRGLSVFMDYYQAHVLDRTRPYEGIPQLLAAVHAQGRVLSVLTNKPEAPSRAILTGLGLASYFVAVVGEDTLPTKKPDPHGVCYLQQLTGVELSKTLLIGDSRVDCETGHAAGVATCGVTWGFGAQDLTVLPPQFLVDTPEQLRRLILSGTVNDEPTNDAR
jgi:phosphoglycolate phosphatase